MNQREENGKLVSAYLDGELSADERARAQQLLASDQDYVRELEELRAVSVELQQLPAHRLDDQFPMRVITAAQSSGAVLPSKTPAEGVSGTRSRPWRTLVASVVGVAATLLLAVLVVRWSVTGNSVASPQPARPRTLAGQLDEPSARDSRPQTTSSTADFHQAGDAPEVAADQGGSQTSPRDANSNPSLSPPRTAATAGPASDAPADANNGQMVSPEQISDQQHVTAPGDAAPAVASPSEVAPAQINIAPGRLSQQISLVIDVTLKDDDQAVNHFERVLRDCGVVFDSNIRVEKELEESLLASRYFEPAGTAGQAAACTVIFVVSSARAIDQVWGQLRQAPADFVRVDMDIALQPADASLFDRLRELSRGLNPGAVPQAAAYRLELPATWHGTASPPVDQAGLLSGSNAGVGQGPGAGMAGLLGGDISTETIFVLRQASSNEPPQDNR